MHFPVYITPPFLEHAQEGDPNSLVLGSWSIFRSWDKQPYQLLIRSAIWSNIFACKINESSQKIYLALKTYGLLENQMSLPL